MAAVEGGTGSCTLAPEKFEEVYSSQERSCRDLRLTAVHHLQRQFLHGIPTLKSARFSILRILLGRDNQVNVFGFTKGPANAADSVIADTFEALEVGMFRDPIHPDFVYE